MWLTLIMKKNSTIKYLIFILILIILGGFLRFYNIEKASYWMDEGYTINAVLSIQEKGEPILDSGNKYNCPTYCYPTSWIANQLGNNALSFRLLSILAGLIFILAIGFITKKFFGTITSIATSIIMTFSYWQIAWSRQARWYTLFALFFWLALFFFYKLINSKDKNKIWLLLGTIFFTALACLTHGLGYLLPVIFIVWYLFDQIFIKKQLSWKKLILTIIISFSVLFLFDSILGINLFGQLMSGVTPSYILPYYLNFILRNYWLFLVFALYAIYTPKKEDQNIRYFLLFIFISYLIPLSFLTNLVHYRYLFHVIPALVILGILGMYDVYQLISKNWLKIGFVSIITILFFTVGGGVFIPKDNYMLEADNKETLGDRPHYAYTPQPQWNNAYKFIKTNKKSDEIVISSMPQFNKIFLGEAGYWIKYNYLGLTDKQSRTKDNKEFYVGAETINNLDELIILTSDKHGYIIFDYMAMDGKIEQNIIDYINNTFPIVFYEETNSYSQVWVYKF